MRFQNVKINEKFTYQNQNFTKLRNYGEEDGRGFHTNAADEKEMVYTFLPNTQVEVNRPKRNQVKPAELFGVKPEFPGCTTVGQLYWNENPEAMTEDMLEVQLPDGKLVSVGWFEDRYYVDVTFNGEYVISFWAKSLDKVREILPNIVNLFLCLSQDKTADGFEIR